MFRQSFADSPHITKVVVAGNGTVEPVLRGTFAIDDTHAGLITHQDPEGGLTLRVIDFADPSFTSVIHSLAGPEPQVLTFCSPSPNLAFFVTGTVSPTPPVVLTYTLYAVSVNGGLVDVQTLPLDNYGPVQMVRLTATSVAITQYQGFFDSGHTPADTNTQMQVGRIDAGDLVLTAVQPIGTALAGAASGAGDHRVALITVMDDPVTNVPQAGNVAAIWHDQAEGVGEPDWIAAGEITLAGGFLIKPGNDLTSTMVDGGTTADGVFILMSQSFMSPAGTTDHIDQLWLNYCMINSAGTPELLASSNNTGSFYSGAGPLGSSEWWPTITPWDSPPTFYLAQAVGSSPVEALAPLDQIQMIPVTADPAADVMFGTQLFIVDWGGTGERQPFDVMLTILTTSGPVGWAMTWIDPDGDTQVIIQATLATGGIYAMPMSGPQADANLIGPQFYTYGPRSATSAGRNHPSS